jgi:hypothetical protein
VGKTLTGKPCVRCGSTHRYSSGGCVACVTARSAAWYQANRESTNVRSAAWYRSHREITNKRSTDRRRALRVTAAAALVKTKAANRHSTAVADRPCPCDTCAMAIECRVHALACESFKAYVAGAPARVWSEAPRLPTRSTWRSLTPSTARPQRAVLAAYG